MNVEHASDRMSQILKFLSKEELTSLLRSAGKLDISKGAEKIDEITSRIRSDRQVFDLVTRSEEFLDMMSEKASQLRSLVRTILNQLRKSDLSKLNDTLGKAVTLERAESKESLIFSLLDAYSPIQIISSDLIQGRITRGLKSKRITQAEFNEFSELVKSMSNSFASSSGLSRKALEISERTWDEVKGLCNLLEDSEQDDKLLEILDAAYRMAAEAPEKITPEYLSRFGVSLKSKFKIERPKIDVLLARVFLYQSLIRSVRELKWSPNIELFLGQLKNEYAKLKNPLGLAPIPSLRERLCQRLGIEEQAFDQLLIQAWRSGKVELRPGSPIGEKEPRFLVVDNLRYYYLRMET